MSGNYLRAARSYNGLSQEKLAKTVERSQSWLSLVECGKLDPTHEQRAKLAAALKIQDRRALSF